MALGKLLEYYEQDAKTEMLWEQIQLLNQRIDDLTQKPVEKKEVPAGIF
jgi:hypothetical protein